MICRVLGRRIDSDQGDVRLVFVVQEGDATRELTVSPTTFRTVQDGALLEVPGGVREMTGIVWRRRQKPRATAHVFVDGVGRCPKATGECVVECAVLDGDVCESCRDSLVPVAKKKKRAHR